MLSENSNIVGYKNESISQNLALKDKLNTLQNHLDSIQHEYRKSLLEAQTELEFQKNRALEFQQKYKATIRYKNQEENLKKILNQLDNKLSLKENQIIELMKSEQEKKKKINDLSSQLQIFKANHTETDELKSQLAKMQQAAVSAIVQKDDTIKFLEDKLQQFYALGKNAKELKEIIIEFQEKIYQLEQKIQRQKLQYCQIIETKEEQNKDLEQKLSNIRLRSEERISRLQQQIIQYQIHIEKLNEQNHQQQNIEQKYYLTEDKLRKSEKKLNDTEILYRDKIQAYQETISRLENNLNNNKDQLEEIKLLNSKIREVEKDNKIKKRQIEELTLQLERNKYQSMKKIGSLEGQKKKLFENFQYKNHQLQSLKLQLQDQKIQNNGSAGILSGFSPQKSQNQEITIQNNTPKKISKRQIEQAHNIIQKLKIQILDKEENINFLNKKLEEQTKDIQQMRQKIVSSAGSAARTQSQEILMVEIEDLNSHIKKVENNLLINKLKHAQNQNYWNTKQLKLNGSLQEMQKQFKKEKAELLERIDRMKKNSIRDKKMDYYQSSLK